MIHKLQILDTQTPKEKNPSEELSKVPENSNGRHSGRPFSEVHMRVLPYILTATVEPLIIRSTPIKSWLLPRQKQKNKRKKLG